jgi:hypothetical protein
VIKVELPDLRKISARLERLGPAAVGAFEAGLRADAGAIMDDCQQNRVPVVTGWLRSSAYVRETQTRSGRLALQFGYQAPHAVYVHEIPYSGHTTRGLPGAMRNGEGYKFLEKSARRVLAGFSERMARRVQAALRGKRVPGGLRTALNKAFPKPAPKRRKGRR